jgi:hypothetical protein
MARIPHICAPQLGQVCGGDKIEMPGMATLFAVRRRSNHRSRGQGTRYRPGSQAESLGIHAGTLRRYSVYSLSNSFVRWGSSQNRMMNT